MSLLGMLNVFLGDAVLTVRIIASVKLRAEIRGNFSLLIKNLLLVQSANGRKGVGRDGGLNQARGASPFTRV